jgi:phage baseplate assembly protein W
MSREIDILTDPGLVDFAPIEEAAEIVQNVKTILSTRKYDVPLRRDFGLDASVVDQPLPRAKAGISADIIAAIKRYEPRAEITKVSFDGDGISGALKPRVRIRINA